MLAPLQTWENWTMGEAGFVPRDWPHRLATARPGAVASRAVRWRSAPAVVSWLCIGAYTGVTLHETFSAFDNYRMGLDLGIFDQATWLISRGDTPFVTLRGVNILADHFSVILYLVAPLYRLWGSAKLLLVIQTLALAAGGWVVYLLARDVTGSGWVGASFCASYLVYPPMRWSNHFEFHPDTLATPLLLGACLFLLRRRWRWYCVTLALAALTKETAGLSVLALGLYAVFTNRRAGWLTAAAGTTACIVAIATMAVLGGHRLPPYLALYDHYGSSAKVADLPSSMRQEGVVPTEFGYFVELLHPIVFLPLLAPEVAALAIPALGLNLLSARPQMHTIYYQYTALITPFFYFAAIVGFARVVRWGGKWMGVFAVVCICLCAAESATQGPRDGADSGLAISPSVRDPAGLRRILRGIPPDASVTGPGDLAAHMAQRPDIYMFPNPFYAAVWGCSVRALRQIQLLDYDLPSENRRRDAILRHKIAYVIIPRWTSGDPVPPVLSRAFTLDLLSCPEYGITSMSPDIIILKRGANHRLGLNLLFWRAPPIPPYTPDVEDSFDRWRNGDG